MRELIKKYSFLLQDYLVDFGIEKEWALFLNLLVNFFVIISIAFLVFYVSRKVLRVIFSIWTKKTTKSISQYLIKSHFPSYFARLAPFSFLWFISPIIFEAFPNLLGFFRVFIQISFVILWVLIFRSLLKTLHHYLENKERFRDKPLESYVQVLMIFAWGIGIFWIIQLLTGYSIKSLATLGAASAVVLLIFKDTILGFVASFQISVNDIVRIGDWITFEKFGADGFVVKINLATVQVQNFDKTYTTIPTYYLISDSFKNWRGMRESGGRRIKRAIYIKQSSIRFLQQEDLEKFQKIDLVRDYINHRQKDIDNYNHQKNIDKTSSILNGRNQTNLGLFRYYVNTYLKGNSAISQDLALMVRHLAPTEKGLPLEIYCFSKDQRWVNYEHIQADIFDHILAALPYFDLEIFELPTGADVVSLKKQE